VLTHLIKKCVTCAPPPWPLIAASAADMHTPHTHRYHDCTAEVEKEDKITRLRICTVLELWAELQGEDLAPEEKFLTFVKTRLQAVDGVRPPPLTFRFSALLRCPYEDVNTCCHSLFSINLINRVHVGGYHFSYYCAGAAGARNSSPAVRVAQRPPGQWARQSGTHPIRFSPTSRWCRAVGSVGVSSLTRSSVLVCVVVVVRVNRNCRSA
jgi:hypothetical protein